MNRTALKSKLSIIDGGNGTEIEKLLPKQVLEEMSSEWIAITSITHPEIVKKVHADFVKAGANFIIANTYNVNYNVLNSINKGDLCEELIENSMKLAREAMKEQKTAENDCFLAASISEHPPKCTRKENDKSRQNFPGWQDQKTVASNFEKTATLLLNKKIDCFFIELIITKEYGFTLLESVKNVWKSMPKDKQVPVFLGLCPRLSEDGRLLYHNNRAPEAEIRKLLFFKVDFTCFE